jgi:hypothetical protein
LYLMNIGLAFFLTGSENKFDEQDEEQGKS